MPAPILSHYWWIADLAIFFIALLFAWFFTPCCKKLAALTGFMDCPRTEVHKKHTNATPLLGGLAMFGGWAGTILAGMLASRFLPETIAGYEISDALRGLTETSAFKPMLMLILGGFMAILLGLLDDRKPLSAGKKMIGQIAIALFAVYFGELEVTFFNGIPGLLRIDPAAFAWVAKTLNIGFTVFWFVLIFNAINFFDNMDGLAVGTSCIALCLFMVTAIITGQYYVAAVAAAGAGATLGFWFFNHSPASIFMGDSGSHFLAYLLAVVSVKVTYMTPDSPTYLGPLVPLFILALPLYDVLAVVVIRKKLGMPIYKGDHNHVSHRFVATGMTRKTAVFSVHLLSLIIGLGVLPLIWGDALTCVILVSQAILLLIFISVLQYAARNSTS